MRYTLIWEMKGHTVPFKQDFDNIESARIERDKLEHIRKLYGELISVRIEVGR